MKDVTLHRTHAGNWTAHYRTKRGSLRFALARRDEEGEGWILEVRDGRMSAKPLRTKRYATLDGVRGYISRRSA